MSEPICNVGVTREVSVGAGVTSQANITLPPFGNVSGRVFRPDGVTPIPNMRVRLNGKPMDTNLTGAFRYTCVDAGSYTLETLDNTGLALARATGLVIDRQNQELVRNLVIVARGTVEGTVLDPNGNPAVGVGVTAASPGCRASCGRTPPASTGPRAYSRDRCG